MFTEIIHDKNKIKLMIISDQVIKGVLIKVLNNEKRWNTYTKQALWDRRKPVIEGAHSGLQRIYDVFDLFE